MIPLIRDIVPPIGGQVPTCSGFVAVRASILALRAGLEFVVALQVEVGIVRGRARQRIRAILRSIHERSEP